MMPVHSVPGLVSIHAPTQGATIDGQMTIEDMAEFQSTLPRRERLYTDPSAGKRTSVSIHAPTQGATKLYRENELLIVVSIHAPTQGATKEREAFTTAQKVSIHAPTQGATKQGASPLDPI